jgi:hypothetical protein
MSGGLRDRQRDYFEWVLRLAPIEGTEPELVITDETATLLAAKWKTPLQIGQYLVRAFEAGAKSIDINIVKDCLSRQIDDLESQLTRNGYNISCFVDQLDARPAEIRQLLRGELGRSQEMRAACLPI